jgi:hypothetical protein
MTSEKRPQALAWDRFPIRRLLRNKTTAARSMGAFSFDPNTF